MKISTAILVFSLVSVTPALVMGTPTPIAKWTFENSPIPAGSGPYSPEVGSGSASGSHAGAAVYSSPAGNGSTHSYSSTGWGVNDYWQFQASTIGYQGIMLDWDQTSSSTGPRDFGLEYSTDGSTFNQFGVDYLVLVNGSPNTAWSSGGSPNNAFHFSYNLSSITALNDYATVYFRLMDESTAAAKNDGSTVQTGGTDRVDNFTVTGTQIPDSTSSLACLGCSLGLLEVLRRISNVSNLLSQKHT